MYGHLTLRALPLPKWSFTKVPMRPYPRMYRHMAFFQPHDVLQRQQHRTKQRFFEGPTGRQHNPVFNSIQS